MSNTVKSVNNANKNFRCHNCGYKGHYRRDCKYVKIRNRDRSRRLLDGKDSRKHIEEKKYEVNNVSSKKLASIMCVEMAKKLFGKHWEEVASSRGFTLIPDTVVEDKKQYGNARYKGYDVNGKDWKRGQTVNKEN